MTDDAAPSPTTVCPECGATGRKVGTVTLEALLTEDARARLGDSRGFRFCKTQTCDVAYFGQRELARFHLRDVRVPIYQKATESSRLVCYCFEHRVRDIETEVRRAGVSSIPDAIGQKCKAGLDHCEAMNPQGSCCLGNVRKVMKHAQDSLAAAPTHASGHSEAPEACCVEGDRNDSGTAND